MGGRTPQHPAQHRSRRLASQATEEKWGREGREVLLSHRVTELLVNVDDEGAFRSPSAHASAPSRDCTLDPTHQVWSSLLTWSNCIKPYLIICSPPYHPPNILMTPHLDCSTRNRTLECLTTAGSCVGVWRGCWTGNPTLDVLCMVPRSVKGGRNDGGGETPQHPAQGTATPTPPNTS